MSLFQTGNYTLASGLKSSFKIDCDFLTLEDWDCLAHLGYALVPVFSRVIPAPPNPNRPYDPLKDNALKFANALHRYEHSEGCTLVVDDVFTTGGTIAKVRYDSYKALVAFTRAPLPDWCKAVFTCNYNK